MGEAEVLAEGPRTEAGLVACLRATNQTIGRKKMSRLEKLLYQLVKLILTGGTRLVWE